MYENIFIQSQLWIKHNITSSSSIHYICDLWFDGNNTITIKLNLV